MTIDQAINETTVLCRFCLQQGKAELVRNYIEALKQPRDNESREQSKVLIKVAKELLQSYGG